MALATRFSRYSRVTDFAFGIFRRNQQVLAVTTCTRRAVIYTAHHRAIVDGLLIEILLLVVALAAGLVDIMLCNRGFGIVASANRVTAVAINTHRNFRVALLQELAVSTLKVVLEGSWQSYVRVQTDTDLAVTLGTGLDLLRAVHW